MKSKLQTPNKPRPSGHSAPTFKSVTDHHKLSGVTPSIVRGHARGANMETPMGHTKPTLTKNPTGSVGAAGKVTGQNALATRLAKQKSSQKNNSMQWNMNTNTDRG